MCGRRLFIKRLSTQQTFLISNGSFLTCQLLKAVFPNAKSKLDRKFDKGKRGQRFTVDYIRFCEL